MSKTFDEEVVVIKEETFTKIYIYGFGKIIEMTDDHKRFIVELEDNHLMYEASYVVPVSEWVDYVDERHAEVVRCDI